MENVLYLEDMDFNPDGSLKQYVNQGKPCVIMVQGNYCGYCKQAKPAFQQLASQAKVICATIQIDGEQAEKSAGQRIPRLDPQYRGVPHYMGFNSAGKFVKSHQGGRDVQALLAFCNSL